MISFITLGGIITLFAWGAADYCAGKSGRVKQDPLLSNIVLRFIFALIIIPVFVFSGQSLPLIQPALYLIGSSLLFNAAYIFFIQAFSKGKFGVVTPIGNSYALITLLIGVVVFGASLTTLQITASILIVAGIIVLSLARTTLQNKRTKTSAILWAMAAMFSWGFGFSLLEPAASALTWPQFLVVLAVLGLFFSFVLYSVIQKRPPPWNELRYSHTHYAWLAGAFMAIGAISLYISIDLGESVVIPVVLASASPLGTFLIAHIREKERLSSLGRVGAMIVVVGVILLNLQ